MSVSTFLTPDSAVASPTVPNPTVSDRFPSFRLKLRFLPGVRVSRTPGNRRVYLHEKKLGTQPKCGDCGTKLPGVRGPTSLIYASGLGGGEVGS